MDTSDEELQRELRSWFSCFTGGAVRWAPVRTRSGLCHGVVVELSVALKRFTDANDERFFALTWLREVADLARLVLLARPALIAHKLRLPAQSHESPSDAEAGEALVRGVPAALRLVFRSDGVHPRVLWTRFAEPFARERSDAPLDEEYADVRRKLLGEIDDVDVLSTPVDVTLAVDATPEEQSGILSLLDVEDLFVSLTGIAQEMYEHGKCAHDVAWAREERHLPMIVDRMELTLGRLSITPEVVKAAQALVEVGLPVDCKALDLDLRWISCSSDELLAFVTAITRGATQLRITTGVLWDYDRIDARGEDRRGKIAALVRTIASIEHLHTLDLSGLLALCHGVSNRQCIVRCVVETLLTRDAELHSLVLDGDMDLSDRAGEFVQRAAAEFRAAHPGVKLRVKRLGLTLDDSVPGQGLAYCLSALDDAEEISIAARSPSPPISEVVQRAILRLPSLRRLRLDRVSLPTMDLYDPSVQDRYLPSKPALEKLDLDDLRLEDVASIERFVCRLRWPPTSALATSLQQLHLRPLSTRGAERQQLFNHESLVALDTALYSNRVLSHVALCIDPGCPEAVADEEQLYIHNGDVLPVAPALCRANHVTTRNLAFLSTIRDGACEPSSARRRLDVSLVRVILNFSAPHVHRNVLVEHPEDSDSD